MTSSLSCDYIPIMECKNEYTISLPTPEYIAVCHSLSDSDTRMDIISLESNDRNFKRAAKLLTSMLDPRNGKVRGCSTVLYPLFTRTRSFVAG